MKLAVLGVFHFRTVLATATLAESAIVIERERL